MESNEPQFTSYDGGAEAWRINRLIRTDGRVRELLRMITQEPADSETSQGELIWSEHVLRLHDERGTLQLHVSAALGNSAWLTVMALAAARAWDGEDEVAVEFMVQDETIPWPLDSILPLP